MNRNVAPFKRDCPEVEETFLRAHLARLTEGYFKRFGHQDICAHLKSLSRLTPQHPVDVLIRPRMDDKVDCTVLGFDYASVFSLITGILAGTGFNILSGDVFTYSGPSREVKSSVRRRIVDHFTGTRDAALPFGRWESMLRERMTRTLSLLERGDEGSIKEAKQAVNRLVAERLTREPQEMAPVLYPVTIQTERGQRPFTRLRVVSQDTPGFLYALSNALSLHGVRIEHVRIRTIRGRVEDEIDLVDRRGDPIEDPRVLDRIKMSVLLTKQFTYFLGNAPDPHAAISRFEHLVDDIVRMPEQGQWKDLLTNPQTLQDLARLLGASDFLWEDFIRSQYESLLPLLQPHLKQRRFSGPPETVAERLDLELSGAGNFREKAEGLNRFKDRETFLIDLDHILTPEVGLRELSVKLTALAEAVVNKAVEIALSVLTDRFGAPKTVGGIDARFAVLGLGKMGGAALGYASDIELLFVYSDNGKTDGEKSIDNGEFFARLVREVTGLIQAKREGIFQLDLRLRPHGDAGPLAASLESFCRYYGPAGKAHAYERLSLVRLRAIGGDPELGAQLERLRDEMIYDHGSVDLTAVWNLRERQYREKTKEGGHNAKFSPGGLVDLEYGVQGLQVSLGHREPRLRTPRIQEALDAMAEEGIFSPRETQQLIGAYHFLRELINGMRMLRGSAKDLFLPPAASPEFHHLARRMGYKVRSALRPAEQLRIDFETHTATVRAFLSDHFGREALPAAAAGSVADLVLSEDVPVDSQRQILSPFGFKDPQRAYVNIRNMGGAGPRRDSFVRLAVLAFDLLKSTPNADMALNNWERFTRSLPSAEFHYHLLLSQPMRLEILLSLFSVSQFLADTLVRNPGFLDWVAIPENLHQIRPKRVVLQELRAVSDRLTEQREWLNELRRLRRREVLRIGTRDVFLGVPLRDVMLELSTLADAVVQVCVERAWRELRAEGRVPEAGADLEQDFCIMALGKLGGRELNYSSDIDLLAFSRRRAGSGHKSLFTQVMERVRSALSQHTEEGYVYRVDLRLRPFGRSGELVPTMAALCDYYGSQASLWELQAALKLRPVAGNLGLGQRLQEEIRPLLLASRKEEEVVQSIEGLRRMAIQRSSAGIHTTQDVKEGPGGLRDVEFLVQGLQLIHASRCPALIEGNTLSALEGLEAAGILPQDRRAQLSEDYLFLRRIEHFMQILEDRQIHALPRDAGELESLARRALGEKATGEKLKSELKERTRRIHQAYEKLLPGIPEAGASGSTA